MENKPLNRESLKLLFGQGSRPNEDNFASLINSQVNKVDDGISKNINDGLILSPEGGEKNRLISFYEKIQDDLPKWSFELLSQNPQGLSLTEPNPDDESQSRFFVERGGNVGINTQTPRTQFEVNGIMGSSSRIGTYKLDTVPADGKWHDIITGLSGCNAFEIMAQVGKKKTGKYALLHATALSTFGKSHSKIRRTQAYYGWWWNRLSLRWVGSTYDYSLQIRTRSNYGKGLKIKFYATKLWDNDIMTLIDPEEAQAQAAAAAAKPEKS